MKAVLIHGLFDLYGGRKSLGRLADTLRKEGYDVELFRYGTWGVLRHYFGDWTKDGARCAEMIEDADLIITHSHGAVMMEYADEHVEDITRDRVLVQFSPAHDMDKEVPWSVRKRFTFHTRRDGWVRIARWMPLSRMGGAGCYGYHEGIADSINIDCTTHIRSHSQWFNRSWAKSSAYMAIAMHREGLEQCESDEASSSD